MKTSTAIQQLRRHRRWLLSATVYTVIASAAWYCIFRLPFSAPPSGPRIRSTSYAVGFNNRVAIASVLVLIAALTVRALRRRSAAVWVSTAAPARISRTVIVTMVVAYSVITAAIYVIARSAEWYGLEWESSHFLWRMK